MIKAKFVHVDEGGCKLRTLGSFKVENIPRVGEHILCHPGIDNWPVAYQVTDVIYTLKPRKPIAILVISILNELQTHTGRGTRKTPST